VSSTQSNHPILFHHLVLKRHSSKTRRRRINSPPCGGGAGGGDATEPEIEIIEVTGDEEVPASVENSGPLRSSESEASEATPQEIPATEPAPIEENL